LPKCQYSEAATTQLLTATTKTTTLTDDDIATVAASAIGMAQGASNTATSFEDTPPSLAASRRSPPSSPTIRTPEAGGTFSWDAVTSLWNLTYSASSPEAGISIDYDYNIGLLVNDVLTQTPAEGALEGVSMQGTINFDYDSVSTTDAFTMAISFGEVGSPIIWTGINTNTLTMNGTISLTASIVSTEGSGEISAEFNFEDIVTDRSGLAQYPSGTMTIAITANNNVFNGTVTYNGTSTATLVFNGNSYSVDLDSGVARK